MDVSSSALEERLERWALRRCNCQNVPRVRLEDHFRISRLFCVHLCSVKIRLQLPKDSFIYVTSQQTPFCKGVQWVLLPVVK